MLDNLQIKGFRVFENYAVEDLGRVNLFVGRNNSGKTTILEAAEILLASDSAAAVVGSAMRRGEMHVPREGVNSAREIDATHLFHGHAYESETAFQISGVRCGKDSSLVCEIDPSDASQERSDSPAGLNETPVLSVKHSKSAKPVTLPMLPSGAVLADFGVVRGLRARPEEEPVRFVKAEGVDNVALQELWDAIALTEEESNVVESLRILESRIDRVAFLSSKFRLGDRSGSAGIYVKLSGVEQRIPLGSLGDGIKHLLTLSLAVIRCAGGYVMIDEIDTGLHHSVMSDMWRVLIGTAERLNVQIFATTHSLDCVRSLAWLANTQPDLCRDVRVHRVDSERRSTVVYSPDEISVAAAQHMELRG